MKIPSKVKMVTKKHPVCKCGDYKYDHEKGEGKCEFDTHNPNIACEKYRFAHYEQFTYGWMDVD